MAKRPASRTRVARKILSRVWQHPANEGDRLPAICRAVLWQAYKRTVARPLVLSLLGDVLIRCYPDSNSSSSVVYFNRFFDWEEMNFVLRYLRAGDVALDIGSNIGVYAVLMAHGVGASGRVLAFEPFPSHAKRIRENVTLNGFADRVSVSEVALSDRDGETLFVVDRDVSNRIPTYTDDAASKMVVPLRRLDSVIDHDVTVSLAKLDVEGMEVAVLHGSELLRRARPHVWILEVNKGLLRKRGTSWAALTEVLDGAGYVLRSYDVVRNCFRDLDADRPNVFAVRSDVLPEIEARLESSVAPRLEAWNRYVIRGID